jgi:hypothetical protein
MYGFKIPSCSLYFDLSRDNNTALRASLSLQRRNNNFLHNNKLIIISVATYFKCTVCFHYNNDENHLQINHTLMNRYIINSSCCELDKFPK